MTDFQFEEELEYQSSALTNKKPLFVRLVLATGIVSTDQQADYVLIGFACVMFLFSIAIYSLSSSSPTPQSLLPGILVPGPEGSATFTQ